MSPSDQVNSTPARPKVVARASTGAGLEPVTGSFDARARWGVLLAVLLIAVGWANTFAEMWTRWFPAWHKLRGESLLDRLTKGDSYYTHGPIVPLTSLVIAFFIYKRVGLPVGRTTRSSRTGALVVGLALLLQLAAAYKGVTFASGYALIALLAGLVLLWGGWALLRAYWLPVVLMFFMVPLSMGVIEDLNFRLKFLAGDVAVWITDNVLQIAAVKQGSIVHLQGPGGAIADLTIENVCGGLRSLISLTFFASMFALICRVKGWWRLVMLLLAVPVAVACNVVRITSLNFVAHYWGVENAAPGSFWHDTSGLLVFALALGLLFGFEQLITLAARWWKRDWTDHRLMGYLDQIKPTGQREALVLRPAPLAALALVAVLSLLLALRVDPSNRGDLARRALEGPDHQPSPLVIDGVTFASVDQPLSDLTLTILQTDDYLCRTFTHPQGTAEVTLLMVFSPNNRKGTHEPEVCLTGSGEDIVSKRLRTIRLAGVGDVTMRELVTQRGRQRTLYLYVYKATHHYTASFFSQQFQIFLNELSSGFRGGNASGALIRFSAPIDGDDEPGARKTVLAAVEALMPQIDRRLP